MERPWFKFCGRDWLGDLELLRCSIGARGLWIGMLSLMNEGVPYGHLADKKGPITHKMLASIQRLTPSVCQKLLFELEGNQIFSRTKEGVIFSRRMLRDEEDRNAGAERQAAFRKRRSHGNSNGNSNGAHNSESNGVKNTVRASDSDSCVGFEKENKENPYEFEAEARFQTYKSRHPGVKTRDGACRAAYLNRIVMATEPMETADSMDRLHEKWLKYWKATKAIPLGLFAFLVDGDCLTEPPELTEEQVEELKWA